MGKEIEVLEYQPTVEANRAKHTLGSIEDLPLVICSDHRVSTDVYGSLVNGFELGKTAQKSAFATS